MRNFTASFIIVLISLANLSANNEPRPMAATFTIEQISFQMNSDQMAAYSLDVNFEENNNTLVMSSETEINFVQILNADGELEYQLPIFSNDIIIDLNDFDTGDYQLNLIMKDEKMVNSSFTQK